MTSPKLARYITDGNDQGRYYVSPTTGSKLPSVTSVLRLVQKDFSQYSANLTAQYCVENWMNLGGKSDEKAYNQARFRWKDARDARAEVGNSVHSYIEYEHTGQWPMPDLGEEEAEIINRWYELNQWYKIEPVLSEFSCFNEAQRYAGTADGLWVIDGKRYIVDVKTSKSTYDEHWMQLAALGACPIYFEETGDDEWREHPLPQYDGFAICHLRADGAEMKFKDLDEMDLHRQQFFGYCDLWHLNNELKILKKEKENI